MKTDSLNRRLRVARPQPIDTRIELRARDLAIFRAIHRHGPLPSNYLFQFGSEHARNFNEHQKRLTKLYNGVKTAGSYLARPPQQFACFEARYQPIVYDLTANSKAILSERGFLSPYCPERTDPFVHRLMAACVSASIELTAGELNIRYISTDEIFASAKCPEATKCSTNPLAIPLSTLERKFLVPDGLFGLQYPHGGFAFFALEIDRKTESIRRAKSGQSAFGQKLRAYLDILENKTYRAHWGLPNLRLLTVTTSATHLENMLANLANCAPASLREKFLFQSEGHFGSNWTVPRLILRELLAGPWHRISGTADIAKS